MKILYLGNENSKILDFLKKDNNEIIVSDNKINIDLLKIDNIDFIISFGYRHIISRHVVEYFKKRAINLHISYLPWNRGADPNLWSFLENTPKGVSIHYIDEKLDNGDILVQRNITYKMDDTLRTTYNRLIEAMENLFIAHWYDIINNNIVPQQQKVRGTYHSSKDKLSYLKYLSHGWDTNVSTIIGKGR